ncbi:MAG: hypothetical protein IKO46_06285 [Salinivirgaceae bacterium]|nr:hypothetical protein [Salinivirgaceae bacterium]
MDNIENENNELGAIILYSNGFKDEKPIFSIDSNFDSKHINNLAPNTPIPDSLIETINKGITLEQLDEVAHLPICHYKTQITIHGVCDKIKSNKVYGYAALVINSNKSLGVRWLAIDLHKKGRIADYVGCYDWRTYSDSQVYCYVRRFKYTKDNKDEVYNRVIQFVKSIDQSLFYGYIDVFQHEYRFSADYDFEVVIYLQGIYEKNIRPFLEQVCADNWENIEKAHAEFEQRMEEARKEREKEEEARKERAKKAKEEYEQWVKDNPFDDKFQKIDFADLQSGDIIGYYKQTSEGGGKYYYELYLNYKRLCYRSCDENGVPPYKSGHVLERKDLPDEFWVWRRNADRSTTQSTRPERGSNIEILDYRTDEVVVLGYTKHVYHELKDLGGGKWDKYINIEGRPMAQGWRFPRSKRADLERILGVTAKQPEKEPEPQPAVEPEKPQEAPKTNEPEKEYLEKMSKRIDEILLSYGATKKGYGKALDYIYENGGSGKKWCEEKWPHGWDDDTFKLWCVDRFNEISKDEPYKVGDKVMYRGKVHFIEEIDRNAVIPKAVLNTLGVSWIKEEVSFDQLKPYIDPEAADRGYRLHKAKAKAAELYAYAESNLPAPKFKVGDIVYRKWFKKDPDPQYKNPVLIVGASKTGFKSLYACYAVCDIVKRGSGEMFVSLTNIHFGVGIGELLPIDKDLEAQIRQSLGDKEINKSIRYYAELGGVEDYAKYQQFIQKALQSKGHDKIDCTELLSEYYKQKVNETLQKEITKYFITADDIRHIRKIHGRQSEYKRGQIPITNEDLAKIPEILAEPKDVDLPLSNVRNGQGIRFFKEYPDGTIYCVMIDEYEESELSTKTGYKKPPLQGIDVLQKAAPKLNVRNARALPMLVANVTNFFRIK